MMPLTPAEQQAHAQRWRFKHVHALGHIQAAAQMVGYHLEIDWSGVVPALVLTGFQPDDKTGGPPTGSEPDRQVYIVSPLGTAELTGHSRWSVGVMDLPDFDDIDSENIEISQSRPNGEILDVLVLFNEYINRYLGG